MIILKSLSFYLAVLGILLAVVFSIMTEKRTPPILPIQEPSFSPFPSYISASGIVESIDKNIDLGVPEEGIVTELWVKVGEKVQKGSPLFKVDTRSLEAEELVNKANLEVAQADYQKQKDRLERYLSIKDPRAISQDELQNLRNDVKIAKAKLDQAQAQMQKTKELMERMTVRSPIDGTVLELNIRVGEFIAKNSSAILIGNIEYLQIRVNIDEQNAGYFIPNLSAVAYPKNNTSIKVPLKFSRIEPFVIPKTSLTGSGEERVDTRVLQVIYTFDQPVNYHFYVGQQADVFLEKKESQTTHE
ncbi:MAG: efflux transporter periplasmic adaptor subunit [Chlamydiales bacterium 38-26]|nr:efflux RND transporter periplasmic adaptor subunit [Chlamydiales bacterium]OJV11452.1 MAG: efflux transporter periplasmic adaptor subunit [Chlamydiales bacterium 38-26]